MDQGEERVQIQDTQGQGQNIQTVHNNAQAVGPAKPQGDKKNKAVRPPKTKATAEGGAIAGGNSGSNSFGDQHHSRQQKQQPGSTKLRGLPKDSPEVKTSKTLSWILRHGARSEGLTMRRDGYIRVVELLENPRLKSQLLTLQKLREVVSADSKQRYELAEVEGDWMIRARQGHSINAVQLDMKPILSIDDIPTRIAVHGTNREAWLSIEKQGLSKMTRNHIHLAQGVVGENIISGMRRFSQILIFIDIQRALQDGIQFFLSDNGVVLTAGNEKGFLDSKYFLRVEDAKSKPLPGWEGPIIAALLISNDSHGLWLPYPLSCYRPDQVKTTAVTTLSVFRTGKTEGLRKKDTPSVEIVKRNFVSALWQLRHGSIN